MSRESVIPSTPGSRLFQLGRLAGGLAAGMAAEGVRRLATGKLPTTGELLLTPRNAAHLAERLSQMRGAAMKVGQLLSMEAGDLLPPELSSVLARLREDAHRMPMGQVASVLREAWGDDWTQRFSRFNFQPLAAASIGQVHEALTPDGRRLAIKVQYPGVRTSIDSDVDNVAKLLSLFLPLPDQTDVASLLAEAKRQLQEEADYLNEAGHLETYRAHLGDNPRFMLPEVLHDWTTPEVLVMTYVPGDSLETLERALRQTRHQVATDLLELALRELFGWGLVQTDPNFSNYRYDAESGRIGLLDFGAARSYPPARIEMLRRLLAAGVRGDAGELGQAAADAGYLRADDSQAYRETVVALLLDATEPTRHRGEYGFASSGLAGRMSRKVTAMRLEERCWRLPPPDLIFLHRKLGGLYMLCSRLRVQMPVRHLVEPYVDA